MRLDRTNTVRIAKECVMNRNDAIRAFASGYSMVRANLSNLDLRCVMMVEAKLTAADLSCADLTGANLSRSDLSLSNLTRAKLRWVDLTYADLTSADLYGADLTRANLTGANLTRTNLSFVTGLALPKGWVIGIDGIAHKK